MSAQILGTIKMDEIHNIVAEQNGWGQLEDGSWINLKFTVPHEHKETTEIPEIFVTGMSIVGEEQSEVSSTISSFTDSSFVFFLSSLFSLFISLLFSELLSSSSTLSLSSILSAKIFFNLQKSTLFLLKSIKAISHPAIYFLIKK